MREVIVMQDIYKTFGDKKVLKGVSCNVKEGEIFGLLGPSGAGKTTIINILTGQMRSTTGKSSLFGVDTQKLTDDIHNNIGMVLDDNGLYSRLSCYDNLAIFARIFKVEKAKINEVLKKVKLDDAIKKPVSKLSKGMVQRLVIARALLHSPKILFLDEPTSGLDPTTMLEIHKLIFECKNNGATIFLTTHNMEEATKLCDNVALLNEGVIVEYGNPDSICRKHNTEKKIKILLNTGEEVELLGDSSSAKNIANYFQNNLVESIHSSEPTLETVFIKLTGRNLQ